MAEYVGQSLPKQISSWHALKGAYRFLKSPRIMPEQIGSGHRALTLTRCQVHPVVLCVQDDTEIHGARMTARKGGKSDEVLHSTLAVLPDGDLLGILDQRWFKRVKRKKQETRLERSRRWRETDVWSDAVVGVDALAGRMAGGSGGASESACRLIHVADRASDNLRFMHTCLSVDHGFVIRAMHDRRVEGWRVEGVAPKLWEHMAACPASGTIVAKIGQQRNASGKIKRQKREAVLTLRLASVQLEPPQNHVDEKLEPLTVNVVYLREENPPAGVEAVDWMILTSESVEDFEDACRIVAYYRCRWLIEEWHRALKEGCRLEYSQVHEILTLRRLSAILSIVAIRLLQVRNLAQGRSKDAPAALQATVDSVWIEVVALLADVPTDELTPERFWKAVAKQGGFIGRKSDGHPGWKVIWRGWHDISLMIRHAELLQKKTHTKRCG